MSASQATATIDRDELAQQYEDTFVDEGETFEASSTNSACKQCDFGPVRLDSEE